jgi:hypothetical protein
MDAKYSIMLAAGLTAALVASVGASMPAAHAASAGTPAPAAHARSLGPAGYGALKLGMTEKRADATGLLAGPSTHGPNPVCPIARLKGAPAGKGIVWFSPKHDVVAISAYGSIATPQGARLGITTARLLKIYPSWSPLGTDANGRGYVKVPGNAHAEYRIETAKSKVSSLTLQADNEDCYE